MKLTILCVMLGMTQLIASQVFSQTSGFNLNFQNTALEEVLMSIEEESNLYFIYNREVVDVQRKVDIEGKNLTMPAILESLFRGTNIEYEIQARHIVLKNNKSFPQSSILSISGKISDASGVPLPGVTVVIKGTMVGSVSDADGNYHLNEVPSNSVLVFSFVGMKSIEVKPTDNSVLNITMTEDAIGLEEVVAIGYGTMKKVNVIGSITQINSKDITVAPVSNVSSMLAGRLPGAIFSQASGMPGANAASIRIRGNATLGNNTPLVIIDGIPGRDLNLVNPDDIESISVLKDASAAIYGARAANGVILVTTKRGAKKQAPDFTYRYSHGFLSPTKIPEMADAATYAQMIREYQSYKGTPEASMRYSLEDVEKYKSGEYPWTHPNTNWYDAVFKKYSTSKSHNISLTGGSEKTNYYIAYGSQADDGLYVHNSTHYNRYNLKVNLDVNVNDYLSFKLDLGGIQENRKYPAYSSASLVKEGSQWNIFNKTTRMWPTSPAYYPNGLPGPDFERGIQPVVISSNKMGAENDKRYYSNNLFSVSLKIPGVKGLVLNGQYAYDVHYRRNKFFSKPWELYYLDKDAYLAAGNTGKEDGSNFLVKNQVGLSDPFLIESSSESHSKTASVRLNYNTVINDVHNIDAFVAYEQNEEDWEGFDASRRYFLSNQLPYLFAGGDEDKTNGASVGLDARMNYFGRVSYDYKGTYLMQVSLRRDGSLRFSKESGRWGTFPSVLLGWRMSNEEWWQESLSSINFFKLKASWGQMGNDRVSAFQYLNMYRFSQGIPLGEDKVYETGISQSRVSNPNITWEVANIFNFGWESMFLDKFSLNTEVFYERRNNILIRRNASVPIFTGITLPDENYGIVDNYGFELVLGYNDHKGDFKYGVNGNFNFARNKIIEFDEPERSVPWQVRTGKPQGALLLYNWIGIFKDQEHLDSYPHVAGAQPGDLILEDYNEDGKIDGADRQLFPLTATPEITFGLNVNLKYKSWELSALLQGQGKALRRLDDDIQRGLAGNYFMRDAIDRWTPENTEASRPRAFNWQDEYWRSDDYVSTYFYDDISFARVKNLQLSYTLPKRTMNSLKVKDMKLYFSGQNLWLLWSAQDLVDPENANVSTYPLMKILSVGAQITF
ncbi:TonB-dependent receptor [Sunxiuqinia elliptica]|nr:TonB-dependent receptor [Sunxiuqinia elliptica]